MNGIQFAMIDILPYFTIFYHILPLEIRNHSPPAKLKLSPKPRYGIRFSGPNSWTNPHGNPQNVQLILVLNHHSITINHHQLPIDIYIYIHICMYVCMVWYGMVRLRQVMLCYVMYAHVFFLVPGFSPSNVLVFWFLALQATHSSTWNASQWICSMGI